MKQGLLLIVIVCITAACTTTKVPYISAKSSNWSSQLQPIESPIQTLFVVGDAGKLDSESDGTNYVLEGLKTMLKKESSASTLVYVGDNVYPHGFVKKKDPSRAVCESILDAQLEMAKYVNGNTFFIPGNHDWNDAHSGGLRYIKRQEKYIESYYDDGFDKKVKMYPSKGCGDPKVIKVHKDLVYVFIDSQWWLQDRNGEPNLNHGCDVTSRADFMDRMNEIFIKHKNDEVVVFIHHPTYSNGSHGGKYSLREHLFPLTMFKKKLYLPLPVIGSLFPLYRQLDGSRQDIQNKVNKELTRGLSDIAKSLKVNTLFVSGHEHNLQYFDKGLQKYIVSGSGAKASHAAKGNGAEYARAARGFVKINFYKDNEAWAEFYTVDGYNQLPKLDFKTQLRSKRAGTEETIKIYPKVIDSDTLLAVDEGKKASALKETFLGEQYRDMWVQPITAPIIDLEKEKGGLRPVKIGGGMSSNSLRLEANDGKQYILRSINKVFTRSLPDDFKNLKVIDFLRDQNSAYHPYGSLVVTELSKAADVYYTDPKVVFLKRQKALGSFNEHYPEELYMFEQRPNGDWSDTDLFGGSKKVISYNDMLEKLREKKNHHVDKEWVLKSRLFDLFIHDWDRHDDQWRWASFKDERGTFYRPIPRDRDLAFYKFVGVIPKFIGNAVITKYKTMEDDVKDVKSLTLNGKYFDRYFVNELEWNEWLPIIEKLQEDLTDEVILNSGKNLPREVKSISDAELNTKLISRRDNLKAIARRYYELLAEEVEITGSDNDEIFDIECLPSGDLYVKVSTKSKKHGDILKYDRRFSPKETKEIRIYGLRGNDEFTFSGGKNDIKVRVVGGEGNDSVINDSEGKNILVYDTKEGIELEGNQVGDKRANNDVVNVYDRYGFLYDATLASPQFHYNRDGLWIGAQYTKINNAWRTKPYRSKNTFKFIAAPTGQNAYRFDYNGHFPNVIGRLDFMPSINVDFPKNHNFFGFGNDTKETSESLDYNWVRMNASQITPFFALSRSVNSSLRFGPTFETYEIYDKEDRILKEDRFASIPDLYRRKNFGGVTAQYKIDVVNDDHKPTSGVRLSTSLTYLNEFDGENNNFSWRSNLTLYMPISTSPEITLVNNLGYHLQTGDAYFYMKPALGNKQGLRGLRGDRFVGDRAFYENVDVRLKLFKWNNVILPMDVGVLGGYDIGRVWLDDEISSTWHSTQTAGLWLDILGLAIVQPYYSWTEDEDNLSVLLRFSF